MAKTIIGRNLPLYKGKYNSATVYDRFDVVLYNGSSYVSKLPNNQNNAVTNTTYWQLLAKNGEFTEQQLEDFKAEVVAESKEEMDDYTDGKKDELDTYTSGLESDFNDNATAKTTAFNNNATSKTGDFDSNASSKTTAFNTNASDKTTAFNSNATSKTNDFNDNASSKTTTFNSNATEKTTAFDNNASDKTTAFNSNATSKTGDFDSHVTSKTTDFDTHVTEKTTAFDEHVDEKIDEFDENAEEMQQEIDELSANMPWANPNQATSFDLTDCAKYSRNRMKILGNTEQQSYLGYNVLNLSKYSYSENDSTLNGGTVSISDGIISLNGTNATATMTAKSSVPSTGNRDIIPAGTYYFAVRTNGHLIDGTTETSTQFTEGVRTLEHPYRISQWFVTCTSGSTKAVPILISLDSTKTDYEPFVGRSSGTKS